MSKEEMVMALSNALVGLADMIARQGIAATGGIDASRCQVLASACRQAAEVLCGAAVRAGRV